MIYLLSDEDKQERLYKKLTILIFCFPDNCRHVVVLYTQDAIGVMQIHHQEIMVVYVIEIHQWLLCSS